ncbi:MAG: ABC transporter permease [Gemmatimonadetes bacterium]|nr:MAG: ABC transporter permease [Gemmatimonadota bacterium]
MPTLIFALREALTSFRRTRVMVLISIAIIAMSLLLFGVFMLVTQNVETVVRGVQAKVEIVAYVADSLSLADQQHLRQRIQHLPGVKLATFVSKADALAEFQRDFADRADLLTALTTNPLPASFQIRLTTYESRDQVATIARQIEQLDGVTDVMYGKEWLARLDQFFFILRWASLMIGATIAFASIFVIYNTIKLTVYSRQMEIKIMQYVGATAWMIRLPFMLEGMMQGMLGAGISLLFLYLGYTQLLRMIPEGFSMVFLTGEVSFGLVGLGIMLGGIGSWISIRRFLDV